MLALNSHPYSTITRYVKLFFLVGETLIDSIFCLLKVVLINFDTDIFNFVMDPHIDFKRIGDTLTNM